MFEWPNDKWNMLESPLCTQEEHDLIQGEKLNKLNQVH
jgi:hypothetical protein